MPALDWLPASFRERSRLRKLAPDECLFHQGDEAQAIFEIELGRLRLIRHALDSRRIVLHTGHEGELLAEAALFSSEYHCDAVAAVASRVRIYPKRELLALFRDDREAAERFMAVLARQVQALRARLEERNIRSARERLLHHLALHADADGRMAIEGTLIDLATEIGLTPEALYRTLAALEKDRMVRRTASGITLERTGAT